MIVSKIISSRVLSTRCIFSKTHRIETVLNRSLVTSCINFKKIEAKEKATEDEFKIIYRFPYIVHLAFYQKVKVSSCNILK